ncbi:mandelate racemase/muconate lactonizing enzyme family protein [Arthrospiribacter ruber]|uniref:Mandelate racemase/muconate lactonizing enzyme family protein n=1 Tax=Arthrospiribacter ruber TaxID=2487934 RepID=A0A951MHQ9_9BACT|nr:mandelate racemase/muconate lactonizing enzyme family protein [Arthrospiribacter ruber]MBW3469506.1 mandelate racemase/muconate lactonizing enzyme family protein [Arthrospiribacter ruber]
MKNNLEKIIEDNKIRENKYTLERKAEIENPGTLAKRRDFLKKTALGGMSLSALMGLSLGDTLAETSRDVNRFSNPTDLKITDMRYCVTSVLGRTAIIRIDTNQGIYGLGEVRDGADPRYALMLKSRILGENPCNVEKIFKIVKQFGGPARQAGGVCAVEMAMWDLCGKAYNVPAWQLLGGRYRDTVRLYADTPEGKDTKDQQEKIKYRTETQGYTWLKMDVSINEIRNIPGCLVNPEILKSGASQWQGGYMSYANTMHPFTGIQITEKGLDELAKIVENVRAMVGPEIPISTDHYGHIDLNNCIRLGRALDKYRLAWLEDMVPWQLWQQHKTITEALETPTTTGEDIYLLENFKDLIDNHAVDIVHPDLASSGGLLETKKIGDYAEEKGIAMAMHQAGTPVSFMANVHCAAATQNFLALEHHSVDLPWWEDMVKTVGGFKMIEKGYANVPLTAPGLGIELNDEVVKQHLNKSDQSYFEPTPEWDEKRSHDRTYS